MFESVNIKKIVNNCLFSKVIAKNIWDINMSGNLLANQIIYLLKISSLSDDKFS
tara:strand:+ start:748 stop:909 length:162 start_codon:yes stop_codon:yes gene_type:complete